MGGMDATSLGDLIRRRRQEQGLTQQQLAAAVRVHVSSVISWESGEHKPVRKLGAIEKVLGPLDAGEPPSSSAEEALDSMQRELDALRQVIRDQSQRKDDEKTNGKRRAG